MRLSRPSSMNPLALPMREGRKAQHLEIQPFSSTSESGSNRIDGTEKAVMVVEDDKGWNGLGQSAGYYLMAGLIHFRSCFTH